MVLRPPLRASKTAMLKTNNDYIIHGNARARDHCTSDWVNLVIPLPIKVKDDPLPFVFFNKW